MISNSAHLQLWTTRLNLVLSSVYEAVRDLLKTRLSYEVLEMWT